MMPSYEVLPGFSLDLSTVRSDGEEWDFSRAHDRQQARDLLDKAKPMFLIGSPPCTEFSSWRALNQTKYEWSGGEAKRRHTRGMVHLEFVCELYRRQIDEGRCFVHGHPDQASSWTERCITDLVHEVGVGRATCDQCQYGQAGKEGNPIRKRTGWISNSPYILAEVKGAVESARKEGGTSTRQEFEPRRLPYILPAYAGPH